MTISLDSTLGLIFLISMLNFAIALSSTTTAPFTTTIPPPSIECYTCATTNLKGSWYLSGYPLQVSPNSFSDDCSTAIRVPSLGVVKCNDTCVTYKFAIFTDKKYNNAFVRGCLSALTGKLQPRIAKDYCEYEESTYFSKAPYLRQARFCGSDKCNANTNDDPEDGINDYGRDCDTQPVTGAKSKIECYNCEDSKKCKSTRNATTTGQWCFKMNRKNEGVTAYERSVSKVNQFGSTMCGSFKTPSNASISIDETMCFCDTHLCNRSAMLHSYCSLKMFLLLICVWFALIYTL